MKRIALNGFGRIGRPVLKRIIAEYPRLRVVAINDLTEPEQLAHLLKHDSVYGTYGTKVSVKKDRLVVGSQEIKVFAESDPSRLPWKDLDVDVVLECTGRFTSYEGAKQHVAAGAKCVVISAPSKDPDKVSSYVLGLNAHEFRGTRGQVVDMGSCTTNAFSLVTKVVQDTFGIKRGFMSTIHSYTNNQRLLDLPHKDLRRARAAALNIIPTSTGAAHTIGKVIPEVKGKIEAIAYRVPTSSGSVIETVFQVKKKCTREEVITAFRKASSSKPMKGYLETEREPLVSSDYVGRDATTVMDEALTEVSGDLVRVVSWYDNEWGYAARLGDFANLVASRIR